MIILKWNRDGDGEKGRRDIARREVHGNDTNGREQNSGIRIVSSINSFFCFWMRNAERGHRFFEKETNYKKKEKKKEEIRNFES